MAGIQGSLVGNGHFVPSSHAHANFSQRWITAHKNHMPNTSSLSPLLPGGPGTLLEFLCKDVNLVKDMLLPFLAGIEYSYVMEGSSTRSWAENAGWVPLIQLAGQYYLAIAGYKKMRKELFGEVRLTCSMWPILNVSYQ